MSRGRAVPAWPKPGYMELVVAAAREWNLPPDYIASLQRWLPARALGAGARKFWGVRMDVIRRFVVRRIIICGRVQGVGFRAWTELMALERGVEGWVRNCRNGSVEALFAGPEEVVLTMIELCRQGPPGARVDAVDQREAGSADLALRRRGELFSVLGSVF